MPYYRHLKCLNMFKNGFLDFLKDFSVSKIWHQPRDSAMDKRGAMAFYFIVEIMNRVKWHQKSKFEIMIKRSTTVYCFNVEF